MNIPQKTNPIHTNPTPDHCQFEKLYASCQTVVKAFIRRLVPDSKDAVEVSQNTAIVLWKKYDVFLSKFATHTVDHSKNEEIETHFVRWAMTVARYEILAWKRDKARDRHVFSDDLLEKLSEDSIEIAPHLENQRIVLGKCLKKLPDERRHILLEAYSGRNKPQEIATRTGKTLNAFYQWMHRIRLSLIKCAQKTLARGAYQ